MNTILQAVSQSVFQKSLPFKSLDAKLLVTAVLAIGKYRESVFEHLHRVSAFVETLTMLVESLLNKIQPRR